MPNRTWVDKDGVEWFSIHIPYTGGDNHRRPLVCALDDLYCSDYSEHRRCIESGTMYASKWIADRFGIPVMDRKAAAAIIPDFQTQSESAYAASEVEPPFDNRMTYHHDAGLIQVRPSNFIMDEIDWNYYDRIREGILNAQASMYVYEEIERRRQIRRAEEQARQTELMVNMYIIAAAEAERRIVPLDHHAFRVTDITEA